MAKELPKLIISDWHNGLVPQYWKDSHLAYLGREGQYVDGVVNPILNIGYLSPATKSSQTIGTASIDTAGHFTNAVKLNSDQYIIAKNDDIHQYEPISAQFSSTSPFPYTVGPVAGTHSTHTDFHVDAVVNYMLGGNARVFYFFRDNTDGDAGTYNISGDSFTTEGTQENVFSGASGGGVLDKNYKISATVADNSIMYVSNANFLYSFDGRSEAGTAGIVTEEVRFSVGYIIKDIMDARGFLWMLIRNVFNQDYFVAVWDKQSTFINDWLKIDNVEMDASNILFQNVSMINWGGTPILFVRTRTDRKTEIRSYANGVFRTIAEVDKDAIAETKNSVISNDTNIMWLGFDRILYFMGKAAIQQESGEIYKIQDADELGLSGTFASYSSDNKRLPCITSDVSDDITYFISNNTNVSVKKVRPFSTGNATAGNFKSKVYPLPKLSSLTGITVFFPPISSNNNVNSELEIYINNGTSSIKTIEINHQDVPNGDGSRGWFYQQLGGQNFINVNNIQIGWKFADTETIANSIKPQRIEIEYEPTTKVN